VAWREQTAAQKRRAYRDQPYWGRPVPGWGDPQAEVLIVGLAPAAHGGNRTGRVFTGDSSGDFLFGALYRAGFANQPQSDALGDGLRPQNVYIAAVARCAPPDNKPTPGEIANCLPYLAAEMTALARLRVIVALGRIAFDHTLRVLYPDAPRQRRLAFGHGVAHRLAEHKLTLIASYHPSRQNTQTGRLTAAMFDAVWAQVNALL
jgi:uracil-DNA glycosylase family 4